VIAIVIEHQFTSGSRAAPLPPRPEAAKAFIRRGLAWKTHDFVIAD
jgi:hypothetical protein